MPGNLARFEVTAREPGPLTLETTDGRLIAAQVREVGGRRFFSPDEPIAAGTRVVLEYALVCTDAGPEEGASRTFEFTALAAAELDYRLEPPYVLESGLYLPDDEIQRESFVRVRRDVYDYGSAGADVIRHEATLDGMAFGVGKADGLASAETRVSTFCRSPSEFVGNDCGGVDGVPEGRHTLQLSTYVLGEETPLGVASISIETNCARASSNELVASNGGPAAVDSAVASGTPQTANLGTTKSPARGASASASAGCNLSRQPGSGPTLAVTALAGVGVWVARRRRLRLER